LYVDVPLPACRPTGEELVPVPALRLVRPDLAGDDGLVERDADARLRGSDQVRVRVREDREPPAATASLLERRRHLGEDVPRGQRARERVLLARRQVDPFLLRKAGERPGEHVAVAERSVRLGLGLELVVAVEQALRVLAAEEARELALDAAVPVDERPVAVEGRPA